jgi:trimeric autotransporter adhesin
MIYHSIQLTNSSIPGETKTRRQSRGGGKHALRLIAPILMATCFSLVTDPKAFAVTPAPDGGYPGENTAEGTNALLNLTSGIDNTAVGFDALMTTQTSMENTAVGVAALGSNTSGNTNTAIGYETLTRNQTGNDNTAIGGNALLSNTIGHDNTATGLNALLSNTMGISNTANGVAALRLNTIGEDNTAVGISALEQNIGGSFNTAVGASALNSNSGGNSNTAVGLNALFFNSSGSNNTAHGVNALLSNINGVNNAAHGAFALQNNKGGGNNTALGFQALKGNVGGSNNIAVGSNAGANLTSGSNNIDIGNAGIAGESGRIRIGTAGKQTDTLIAGIYGKTIASGVQVIIGSGGKLGTIQSSARYKDDIRPMDKASEAILSLKPVTFRYKHELDPDSIPQFGLIAEEVEKVNPELVGRDEDGKVITVRYEAVNAMLLNEFLKEHHKVNEQQATITEMKAAMARQEQEIKALGTSLKEQAATIQRMSARLETGKSESQLLLVRQSLSGNR